MAFDFFSQPQGPNIDINLYPNAASAGINAGNAQKTVFQNVVQGINTGLDLYGKYQDTQVKQNQIDQLPVQNQIQEEQLERAQLQNEVAALEVKAITSNEDAFLRQKKAALENAATEAEQKSTDLKNKDLIIGDLASNDSILQQSIFDNPSYQGTLMRDPKFMESVVGKLVQDGVLDEGQQQRAFAALDFSKSMYYKFEQNKVNEAYKQKILDDQNKKLDDLIKTPPFQHAAALGNLSNVDDVVNRVKVYPKGVKTTNEEGLLIKDVPDKTQPEEYTGKYSLFLDDKPILDISEKDASTFNAFTNSNR